MFGPRVVDLDSDLGLTFRVLGLFWVGFRVWPDSLFGFGLGTLVGVKVGLGSCYFRIHFHSCSGVLSKV